MGDDQQFIKAKDYVYRLLSYRQRSIQEVKERLQKKGFAQEIISRTIDYLSSIDYLNDENFARFWLRCKMQTKPVGFSLLRYQLRQKGISEEIISQAFNECSAEYDETALAKKAVSLRRRYYKGLDRLTVKRRLYSYLRRRGFSSDAISQALG